MDEKKENILDIMAEIDAIGDGDKSHLQERVENMESQIVARSAESERMIEPLSVEDVVSRQNRERNLQVAAATHGDRPRLRGEARISNFFLIKTRLSSQEFLSFVNKEVLGNYDPKPHQGSALFGLMIMPFDQKLRLGTSDDAKALEPSGPFEQLAETVDGLLLVKFDAGPWPWYEAASTAVLESIVWRLNTRAWLCGWDLDGGGSWVQHWRPGKQAGTSKMTEEIRGAANHEVTDQVRRRWGIDVRAAFDDLHRAAQWEALRQWLLCGKDGDPSSLPVPFVARVSFLAGNLQMTEGDRNWVPQKWVEIFPGRKPWDGPLHLQSYYEEPRRDPRTPAAKREALTGPESGPRAIDLIKP